MIDRDHDRDCDEVPDIAGTRDRIVSRLLTFARALRDAGVDVPANASITAARALVEVGFDDEARVRAALRAAFVSRHEDVPTFDRLFAEFWRRVRNDLRTTDAGGADRREDVGGLATAGATPDETGERTVAEADDESLETIANRNVSAGTAAPEEGEDARRALYSPAGRSERLSVAPPALEEGESLDRALSRLTRAIAELRGRRWGASGAERVDARRALRRSFATGGAVVSIPGRERAPTAARCVLLVDVSRSVLDTIDRDFLVRFLRAATAEWRSVRTFLFDTHVREVSRELAAPSPAATVAALERAEAEWGGGTRIGNALRTVRREHPDAVDRTTVVFVVSDGLEMGEIDDLEDGMVWLSRRAASVLWLNPLAASPAYEPTCRGMDAALPYVDGLFAFTGPDDLAEIARQLDLHGTGPIGYEHDPRRARDRSPPHGRS